MFSHLTCYRYNIHKIMLDEHLLLIQNHGQLSMFKYIKNDIAFLKFDNHFLNPRNVHDRPIIAYMDCMLSVRFVSKPKNCFPFLLYPLISAPEATNIFSLEAPSIPPNSRRDILLLGNVLNTI